MNATLLFIFSTLCLLTICACVLMLRVKRCHPRRRRAALLKVTVCVLFCGMVFPDVAARAGDARATVTGELFRAREFDISIGGVASIGTAQREKEAVAIGTQVGVDYFATKNLGFGARAELSDFSHSVIDLASGRLTVRAPLWDRVSPYGFAEGGYQFESERIFAGAGGGLDMRLSQGWGLFGELGLETDTRGVATGRGAAGVRLTF